MVSFTSRSMPYAWLGALTCFVLAGTAGVLFRVGMITGLPDGLQFTHIRHGHSHLMYFGWVTPAIMSLIAHYAAPAPRMWRVVHTVLMLAVLSFLPFLLYGYGPAFIGGMQLPLSVMLAGLNIFAWYAFAGLYVRRRCDLNPVHARRFWDAAVAFLIVASVGAWSLGIVQALNPANPFWFAAALHLFLDLFADGWLLMSVVGLAAATMASADTPWLRHGRRLLIAGLPVTFLLGIPVNIVPPPVRFIGSVGGVVSGIGLFYIIRALWTQGETRARRIWAVPLGLLAVKALAQWGLSVPALAAWAYGAGLRILYLHVLLLGVVTLGLLAAARCVWGAAPVPGRRFVTAAVLFLLATLLPLTGLWPTALGGPWVLHLAALGALAPVLAMTALLGRAAMHRSRPVHTSPPDRDKHPCPSTKKDRRHTAQHDPFPSQSL